MPWQTVRSAGSLFEVNKLTGLAGRRDVATFLYETVRTFALSSAQFYHTLDELPFIYKERQVASILLPAMAKVSDAVLVELPISRKSGRKRGPAWLDYWVLYRDCAFFIEVKQTWYQLESGPTPASTVREWETAIDQLAAIPQDELIAHSIDGGRAMKIALLIQPCYKVSAYKQELEPLPDTQAQAKSVGNQLLRSLEPQPNWSCTWALHSDLQSIHVYGRSHKEVYPFVIFAARIDPVRFQ